MRNLKSTLLSLMVLGTVSCVQGSSPVRITGFFPIDTGMGGAECNLDTDLFITRGRLDASGGGDYLLVLGLASDLDNAYTIVNNRGVNLSEVGARNFNYREVVLTYATVPPLTFPRGDTIPTSGILEPGAEARISVDVIGDEGAKVLREQLTDDTKTTLLTVNIQLRGSLSSGETVHSNTVSFPIEVRTTNANCTDGNVTRTGPCGVRGGQDGTMFACCTGPGTPVGCP